MHSTKTWWRRGALTLACFFGLNGAAAWAGTVVISSSGPSARSYPAGKSLAAGSRIVLAAGDTLTLLDSRGTRTLRGPTTASAEASATASNASFAMLVATQNRRRARTGAIRGGAGAAKPDSIWYVNVAGESGTFCAADLAAVRLWRPDMQSATTLTVADDAGKTGVAAFAVGQNTAAWPATVPIAAGRSYTLSGGGLGKPTKLRVALLDAAVSDPAGTYSALAAKSCNAQKDLLVGALASPQ